jgi:transcription initiation factor TFIID subunit 8
MMATTNVADAILSSNCDSPYRRLLKMSICALVNEAGFTAAEDDTLETLTEMLHSFITELGRSTKGLSELSGRTEPIVGDVVVALVEMGQNVSRIPMYARRVLKSVIPNPLSSGSVSEPRRLQVGTKRSRPSHIPDYLPDFPDPHTYIKTLTYKPPVSEYQIVREKASAQKRDIERALTRFIAKTGDTENLFPDDPYAYPLIANKPKPLPYLDALLPKDEDMVSSVDDQQQQQDAAKSQSDKQQQQQATELASTTTPAAAAMPSKTDLSSSSLDDSLIDNPYLRPIVVPKLSPTSRKTR